MSALDTGVARTVRPASAAEVAAALAACAAAGERVLPVGAGTALAAAGAPEACDVALVLGALQGVVDYSPEDMTLTVLAGTPLDTIRQALAPRAQRLPGLPAGAGTIGGLLACGWTAPEEREAQGTLRERLIGAQVADSRGRVTRSGGRVVKNVTGYDLHRMHVGAGGAFGVFTELTFRLEPEPEHRAHVSLEAPSLEAAREAWRWLRAEGPEAAFVCVRPGPVLAARVEGDEEPAREAARALAAGWGRWGSVSPREPAFTGTPAPGRARLSVSLRAAPSRVLDLFEEVKGAVAYPQSGEVWLDLAGDPDDLTARLLALARGTYRVHDEAPAFLPPELPRWSADPGALVALAKLKRALDPSGILRPGSYSADALERAAAWFGPR